MKPNISKKEALDIITSGKSSVTYSFYANPHTTAGKSNLKRQIETAQRNNKSILVVELSFIRKKPSLGWQ